MWYHIWSKNIRKLSHIDICYYSLPPHLLICVNAHIIIESRNIFKQNFIASNINSLHYIDICYSFTIATMILMQHNKGNYHVSVTICIVVWGWSHHKKKIIIQRSSLSWAVWSNGSVGPVLCGYWMRSVNTTIYVLCSTSSPQPVAAFNQNPQDPAGRCIKHTAEC